MTKVIVPILACCLFISIASAQTLIPVPVDSRGQILLSLIKDLSAPLFYLATIILAIYGWNRWKKELKGRSKYEAAKNVIVGAYRVRDAIINTRLMWTTEPAAHEPEPEESDPEVRAWVRSAKDSLNAYAKRYESVASALFQWYPAVVEAEALFPADARKRIEALNFSAQRLQLAIRTYHWERIDLAKSSQAEREQKVRELIYRQNRNITHGVHPGMTGTEENKAIFDDGGFQAGLDSAVLGIKEYFDEYMK